ncbi:uncharacterized protein LOC124262332 isoform X1 [Haliotis rubra]|uniref:uncharacterized protein LOC124262332 isoform X1 n=1 Tax=Haliotis rubra TaxID=36100 RepID=UPI001EE62CFD|nr:uncharacterized protein LOC124262332 isoform X1 [Haliotis rubra]
MTTRVRRQSVLYVNMGPTRCTRMKIFYQAYDAAKDQLEEQVQKQQLKLKDVTGRMGSVTRHQNELGNTQRKLQEDAATVCTSVAVRFLRRQRQLMKEILMSLQAPFVMVQEKLDTLHGVHTSIVSAIDYTQRTLESTRREELITLTDVLQTKCDENQKLELPEDDTQDTRILLSFQGQRALEELIDTFGGLASSLNMDHIPDSQPTSQDLLATIRRERETITMHEGRWQQLQQMIHRIPELKGSDSRMARSQEPEQLTSQEVHGIVTNLITGAFIPGETIPRGITLQGYATLHVIRQDRSVNFIICPKLQLDAGRANTDYCHVTTDGELANSPPATQHTDSGRLQELRGTCSSTPIPLPPSPSSVTPVPHTTRYWETNTRVGVVGYGWGWWPVLEVGVGEESQVDSEGYVCYQRRSLCVSVWSCVTHRGSLCTRVYLAGEEGKCYRNTMSDTPGTQATLHYGVVLDVGRGRIGFIDVDRSVVLGKVDVKFKEDLLPVFAVDPSDYFTVNMKVVSGEEILMSDIKKSLINEVLA